MSLHENVAATAGFPDMTSRAAERWTEQLEAWVERIDTNDPEVLGDVAVEIENYTGQGEAWRLVSQLANDNANYGVDYMDPRDYTAARDAILAIPMPEDTDD
jgi:hypothetical protein